MMRKLLVVLTMLMAMSQAHATTMLSTDRSFQETNGVYFGWADALLWTTDDMPFSLLSANLLERNPWPWAPEWDDWIDFAQVSGYRNGALTYQQNISLQFGLATNVVLNFLNVDTVVFQSGAASDGTRVEVLGLNGIGITAPVPEPETYAMLLGGLALLGGMVRRRKAQSDSRLTATTSQYSS